MKATERDLIMQRWTVIQHELIPELRNDVGTLTPTHFPKDAFDDAEGASHWIMRKMNYG